jgi:iron complex outermembrane recepter protein
MLQFLGGAGFMNQFALKIRRAVTSAFGASTLALLVLCSSLAAADAQARSITYQLDMPAQSLDSALQQLALASQHKLFYTSELVKGVSVSALKGEYTAEEAIRTLLSGTHLTYEITPSSVVLIKQKTEKPAAVNPSTSSTLKLHGRSRLAQSNADGGQSASPDKTDESEQAILQEVLVTGTSIRGAQAPVGSDLVTVGRTEIEAVGARTTTEILATVPQMGFFNGLPRPASSSTSLSTPVDLRGLGTTSTLVLLDGQRLIGDGTLTTFANPSSVPPAAIERIEIVPDGASAVYGSDAVGGVINIITRSNLNGAETSARYGSGRNPYEALDLNQAIGRVWDSGSALLVAAYSRNDNVRQGDLDFYTNDLRPSGGTDLRTTNCFSPNIRIGSATAGTVYAPPDYTVTYPAAAVGDAGRCDPGALADLYSAQKSISAVANLRQAFSDNLHLRAAVKFSRLKATTLYAPGTASFSGTQTLTIPSTNPFFRAPPGVAATSETVLYNVFPLTGLKEFTAVGKSGNALAGLDYDWGRWRLGASFNYGWSDASTASPDAGFNGTLLAAAAAGTTAATALDPFGPATAPALAAAIADWENVYAAKQKLYDYQLKADGPVVNLPGGDLRLAVGTGLMQMNYDALQVQGPHGTAPQGRSSATRKVKSVFAEVLIPLVGGDLSFPGMRRLVLSGAVRYDDYNDFGSTTNPKVGLTWAPLADLALRGSVGTSFHAPDMGAAYAVDTRATFQPNQTNQPPGNPTGNAIFLAGGRPDLDPEEADTFSIGLDYDPSWLPGLRTSATFYDIKFKDQIVVPPAAPALFTNPAYAVAGLWIANPTAEQIAVAIEGIRLVNFPPGTLPPVNLIYDRRRTNLSAVNTNGIDFNFNYRWSTGFGAWSAGLVGNRVLSFDKQGSAGSPFVEDKTIPQWRVRANAAWQSGPWTVDAAVNYLDSFEFIYIAPLGATGVQQVDSFTTVDLHSSYKFAAESGLLSGVTLSVNANNLFEEDPPLQIAAGGYATIANPLGRMLWFGIQKDFGW